MFTSNGIQFQTPFTTGLDKGHIPEDPAMRDICTHDKATPETVAMAVRECAKRHQALLDEWLKTNTPKVCKAGPIRKGLDMSSVIRATGKKECAEFTRRAANADRLDPHEVMDIKADRVEREVSRGREALRQIA